MEVPISFDVASETEMRWFAFSSKNVRLTRSHVKADACHGIMCDGGQCMQGKSNTCVCLKKSARNRNALCARVS